MAERPLFPADFLWGAATSAYQIEGSPLADGAGSSIWHRFAHTPGRIAHGDTGDVACDHYRRTAQDVDLIAALGHNAYRFSISWSRVLPEGVGRVNLAGLDFYRRLIERLREAGIEPMATLYHWDLPAALDDRGGWLNPQSPMWFAEYAHRCFEALDGRVQLWTTINEPWVVTDGGYLHGVLAPGHANLFEAPRAAHHLLQAHAAAVDVYREIGRHQIGLVLNIEPKHPASDAPEDREAARRADAYMNRHFGDPALLGRYPEELAEVYGAGWPQFADEEVAALRREIDFLGLNYYTRGVMREGAGYPTGAVKVHQRSSTYTETDWEVHPESLRDTLLWLHGRYGELPLYVTENGAAFYDPPRAAEGRVDDPLRVAYFRSHLRAVLEAREAGADVRGYFAWSLFDNLEWSLGFSKRFGIVHVDFETLDRTPKASALFLREVIASRGAMLW